MSRRAERFYAMQVGMAKGSSMVLGPFIILRRSFLVWQRQDSIKESFNCVLPTLTVFFYVILVLLVTASPIVDKASGVTRGQTNGGEIL